VGAIAMVTVVAGCGGSSATIAHGKGKAAAVRAAIHGGLIDVLIVDPDLGRSLLT